WCRDSRVHFSDEVEAFAATFRAYSGLNRLVESREVRFRSWIRGLSSEPHTIQEFACKTKERVAYTQDSTQFPFQLETQDRDLIMGIQSFITLKKRRWDRLGKRVSQRPQIGRASCRERV